MVSLGKRAKKVFLIALAIMVLYIIIGGQIYYYFKNDKQNFTFTLVNHGDSVINDNELPRGRAPRYLKLVKQ